jgi:hypothetical protein
MPRPWINQRLVHVGILLAYYDYVRDHEHEYHRVDGHGRDRAYDHDHDDQDLCDANVGRLYNLEYDHGHDRLHGYDHLHVRGCAGVRESGDVHSRVGDPPEVVSLVHALGSGSDAPSFRSRGDENGRGYDGARRLFCARVRDRVRERDHAHGYDHDGDVRQLRTCPKG